MANIQKKILIGEEWLEKKYGKLTILINKIIEKMNWTHKHGIV